MDNQITITKVINKIGRVIESYRDKEDLTQAELGKRINVSSFNLMLEKANEDDGLSEINLYE